MRQFSKRSCRVARARAADWLADIDSRYYAHADFHVSKPNHDLFGEPAFKEADLVCFKVQDLWQAVRVIAEVAGSGPGT